MAEDEIVYEAIIIPALTYVSECWAMKVNNKRMFATTEVRMLRGILVETGSHAKQRAKMIADVVTRYR